ncbi:uncharacterized protein [Aquarana catesbeiana]|uniref:uncharacterized protein n=1 Tax=Aquarana catesbeiana TaxID=8400 RepID=UPI003CC9B6CC
MGDFNYPDIDWVEGTMHSSKAHQFLNVLQDNFMGQMVDAPTKNKALLDLLITNNTDLIMDVEIWGNLGNSDHRSIGFSINHTNRKHKGNTKTLNFKRANFPKPQTLLEDINWGKILETKNTEERWVCFKSILNKGISQCIPLGNKFKRANKSPGWLNYNVKMHIKAKEKAFKKYKAEGSSSAFRLYKECYKILKGAIRVAKIEHKRHIAEESKKNPKKFFKYLSSKKGSTDHIGPIKNEEGHLVTKDGEMAKVLNFFFSSVSTRESRDFSNQNCSVWPHDTSQEAPSWLTEDKIRNRLGKPNINKSPGPDGLHPRVLRELSQIIARQLFLIFTDSLLTGMVPADWRKAPIFKKGPKYIPGNYRPVSLTSIY